MTLTDFIFRRNNHILQWFSVKCYTYNVTREKRRNSIEKMENNTWSVKTDLTVATKGRHLYSMGNCKLKQ